MNKINKILKEMFRGELEIQYRLLNLILSAALIGGNVSLIATIIIGAHISAILAIVIIIMVVGLALWIANKKKKPQIAAVFLILTANMVIFPIMYFTGGGMSSGMPVWMVLGMIFSWLILTGPICGIMYLLNVLTVAGCFFIEMLHPELVITFETREGAYWDMVQSMIVVTCIFGLIFKYQTYVYEKQKRQLLKANQAKSEFLANMSHEVRTPINAILGYNELIMKESQESHTASYALKIQAAGKTLLSLVNDIFDFTTLEQSELKLAKEPYYMSEVLQELFLYADYSTEKKGLKLHVDVDKNIPQILYGDSVRLAQILDNLVSNAVKYTKEGMVEITLRWEEISEQKGKLFVQIKDTGIGMKAEDMKKISESFIRFDEKQTRDIQGIGLGLTIVTQLLNLMDSQLNVESEIGKGSAFSFYLEQEIADNTPIGKLEKEIGYAMSVLPEEEEVIAPNVRILAVDDNPMNLDMLKGMLKNTKMQIDTGVNGEEAVNLLRNNNYHMVLMDHMMPIMNGIEALKVIKEEKLCENTPIIVLTANAVGNIKEEYISAGFDDYISKPILIRQLFAVIRKHLPEELLKDRGDSSDNPLSFLDTKMGMEYCCNSEEFYNEMLNSYLANNKLQEMEEKYQQKDWEQYRILVHALKSTSRSIGAVSVSEEAEKLEMAAKEDRIEYIQENHASVLAQYRELLDRLKVALKPEDKPMEVQESSQSEDKEHILIVDDDSMNLRIAERMLEDSYQVECLKSGEEALKYLERKTPNLILLDLHMPQMDGFEVNKRIKESERLREIPVIFLTADHNRETEIRGFREGALDFIAKPFVADIMLQRIKRILELDRLQKNLQVEVEKQTRKAEARREKVERLSLQTMMTLAHTIDAKDKYTNGHSIRVAEYAREIAKRAGKSVQEQEEIYYVGLLHDIGKIGIPESIINKTTRLTDEEYMVIKSHTQIGVEILENMTEIPNLVIGAHWHHERYDGKGYPDNLKGEEIPEIARIIGVADAYDAMTSKRSYRDVLPQDVVKGEIEKGKNSQFDPSFADIMLAMIAEDTEYSLHE